MTRPLVLLPPLLVAALLVPLAITAASGSKSPPLLLNESSSLARGFYVRTPDRPLQRGDVVAAAQPMSVRTYLAGLGVPTRMPLLKRIAALPGDPFCARPDRLETPFKTVFVLARDRRGVPLPHGFGCRRLGPGDLVLLGDTPTSFDSRYFGPVPRSTVTGVYREVLTW